MSEPTDRFVTEVGNGTVAHIIDMEANHIDEEGFEGDAPEEIDAILGGDVITSTDTAAIIKEKRP